jgi:hypothetical protein
MRKNYSLGVTVRKIPRSLKYRVRVDGRIASQATTKKKALSQARFLRGLHHGMTPRTKKNWPCPSENFPPVEIYAQVKEIVAVKGPGHRCDAACKRAGHTYRHVFKKRVGIYGNEANKTKLTIQ